MTHAGTVVVLGLTSYTPIAGVSWQTVQNLEGLRRLGFDVYYVEDHEYWPYDPVAHAHSDDCTNTVRFIAGLMERFGFGDRWAYRDVASGGVFGLSERRLDDLLGSADLLVNLTGSTVLREAHLQVPVRLYLETDPVLAQIELAGGNERTRGLLAAHTHHASYGANFGAPDCRVPASDFTFIPTRPPVVLDWWEPVGADPAAPFTTVGSWEQTFKDVEFEGEHYTWSKHHEFLKLIDLPGRAPRRLELALSIGDHEAEAMLREHGWSVVDGAAVSATLESYRDYVRASWGEFTVAKDQNVRLRSGWFSDRSACYLAAARPVVTQETGFSNVLPTGAGLFGFDDADGALAAFEAIEADPEGQRRAARAVAEDHFRAETVLGALIAVVEGEPAFAS